MKHAHIIPIGDLREHVVATDCWCHPFEREPVWNGTGIMGRIFAHNAQDCREKWERQGLKNMAPGWDIVSEDNWVDRI